jgi:hypothetical protein
MHLGDNDRNQALGGFVEFDMSQLAPGAGQYESAILWGERLGGMGSGTPSGLDPVRVHEFETDILSANLVTPVGPDLGIFMQSTVDFPDVDVLSAMTSTYAQDGLVQFRLLIEPVSSDLDGVDDYFMIKCGLELRLRYLAP